jgi:hypothetical protein
VATVVNRFKDVFGLEAGQETGWKDRDCDDRSGEWQISQPSASWAASFRTALAAFSRDLEQLRKAQEKFSRLLAEWKSIKIHTSCIEDHILNDAYLRIVGMGRDAVPFILAELEKEPAPWFPALYAITEAQPVRECDYGNVRKMTEAWLEWGRKNNYR